MKNIDEVVEEFKQGCIDIWWEPEGFNVDGAISFFEQALSDRDKEVVATVEQRIKLDPCDSGSDLSEGYNMAVDDLEIIKEQALKDFTNNLNKQ